MTIDFFKENYPNLYKDNEYYFEHNQTAIEYVVRAYTEGYDSGKMANANKSFVDGSSKSLNSLLAKFTDTQLASILGERGYKGEIAKSERLYSTNMQSKVGEKLETIKLGI